MEDAAAHQLDGHLVLVLARDVHPEYMSIPCLLPFQQRLRVADSVGVKEDSFEQAKSQDKSVGNRKNRVGNKIPQTNEEYHQFILQNQPQISYRV
jgi:hypothetical protein